MEFTVPQFIDKKAKIIGPLTFSQFLFLGIAGGICIFLFFATPLAVFIIFSIPIMSAAAALAFLKINQMPLPGFVKNFFFYILKPKVYLWGKRAERVTVIRSTGPTEEKKEIKEEGLPGKKELFEKKASGADEKIKLTQQSKLKNLFTRIETGKKI